MLTYLKGFLITHPREFDRGVWFQEEARAERLTNLIRIGFMVFWLSATIPAIHLHPFSANVSNIGVGFIWLLFAIFYQKYLIRNPYTAKLKYLSTTIDILMITAILFIYHFDMGYSTSLKAMPFMCYLLAIPLTAFRFDKKLALYAGGASIVAYLSLFLYITATQQVNFGSVIELFTTPKINLLYQAYRINMILALSFSTYILVHNIHRLVLIRVSEAENAIKEKVKREQTQDLFERYFTPDIANFLTENPQKLGGDIKHVTVLIIDIRGFTSLSERIGPTESVKLLNLVFNRLTEIVFRNNGTLDKFLGDGMLVVFGIPEARFDDAERAVKTAMEMVEEINNLEYGYQIEIGIAINSGEVIFGNIGSKKRMELTVIGDTVNTTSRMEQLNKKFNSNIVISEATCKELDGSIDVCILGEEQLRGKDQKTKFFTVRGNSFLEQTSL